MGRPTFKGFSAGLLAGMLDLHIFLPRAVGFLIGEGEKGEE
jgi:hypothetical protein